MFHASHLHRIHKAKGTITGDGQHSGVNLLRKIRLPFKLGPYGYDGDGEHDGDL
jgi:hypothetical protein